MLKVWTLITLFTYIVCIISGMVLFDGLTTHLDILLQKHHHHNYEESVTSGLIPPGFHLKKLPAFMSLTEDFNLKWDQVLYDAEKNLVKLLLHESQEVIAKIELDIASELANHSR